MAHELDPDVTPDKVPPSVRTWSYAIGLVCTSVGGALVDDAPLAARILAAVGAAALALALGYRPTR